jgi:PII-like signaling protein
VSTHESLKLTVYFGEGDGLSDPLLDAFARHGLRASVLLRGAEGFGAKHRLRSGRLLTLSEDLPLVALAVDEPGAIERVLPEVEAMVGEGLVTVERADARQVHEQAKLTVYCGRYQRAAGQPAFVAAIDLLRRHGIAGATVLLGVDGTLRGERRRARFVGRNADVPLMIVSVGDGERIAAALPELDALLDEPLVTLERVTVGALGPDPGSSWRKLTVYASEQAKHEGRPLHVELIRQLRRSGAAGATCLRGIWGYHGDDPPHGDRLLSLRRHVPVVTVIVDEPGNASRWFEMVSGMVGGSGLVTSELVPHVIGERQSGTGHRIRDR